MGIEFVSQIMVDGLDKVILAWAFLVLAVVMAPILGGLVNTLDNCFLPMEVVEFVSADADWSWAFNEPEEEYVHPLVAARQAREEAEALLAQVEERWGRKVPGVRKSTRLLEEAKFRRELAELRLVLSQHKLAQWKEEHTMNQEGFCGWLSDGRKQDARGAWRYPNGCFAPAG